MSQALSRGSRTGRTDQRAVESADAQHANFGRFAIRGVLGQGAYGKVYRAFDPDLGREVALKILKRDVSNPGVLRQVRQEARALRSSDIGTS